uniref:2-oxoglutarate-dependent dioxygenase ecdK-like n=1 Tax=Styela clava TaxID=7725 RepID=UPI00193ADADF|nr:2-oxoglutarate-dependent dioxygenase ecdK-like [Styela clava]
MSTIAPVIDFSKCSLNKNEDEINDEMRMVTGKNLYEGFTSSGFVYLKNHGITQERIDGVYKAAANFFALPLEEKKKSYVGKNSFGYDPVGALKVNSKKDFDFVEGFRVTGDAFDDEETKWPNLTLKKKYEELAESCKFLVLRILRSLGLAMRVKDLDSFCNCHSLMNKKGNLTQLGVTSYPPVYEDIVSANRFRLAPHVDWGTMILLFQDNIGGLQMKQSNGEFADVTPIPGTIILNVGETLQKFTGGRLTARVHRVVPPTDPNKQRLTRQTTVYFGHSNKDFPFKSFEFDDDLNNKDFLTEYEGMTTGEFMNMRLTKALHY